MTADGAPAETLHPEFAPLLALWDETRGGRELPLWRDFRPERMRWEIFGRLFVIEVVDAGAPGVHAFRYGLVGEELVDLFGRRATGRLVGPDLFPEEGASAIAFHAAIVARRRPCLGQGHAGWQGGGRLPYEDFYLPFAREPEEPAAVRVIVGLLRVLGRRPEGPSPGVNEVSWQQVTWL